MCARRGWQRRTGGAVCPGPREGTDGPSGCVSCAGGLLRGSRRAVVYTVRGAPPPSLQKVRSMLTGTSGESSGLAGPWLVLQLYFWACMPFVVIKLGSPLVPASPRGPFQKGAESLLGRQHEPPEEAAPLGDTPGAPPRRLALHAARLCNGPWGSIFFGRVFSCRWPARPRGHSAYAPIAQGLG